jgi:membrane associated rhomboid family serine protease
MSQETAFKLRGLFMPAAAFSILLLIIYSAANWFLLSRWQVLDDNIVDFGLPVFIAALLTIVFFEPRIAKLDLVGKYSPFAYNAVVMALIAVPTILGQHYLSQASAHLTQVADASMIGNIAPNRYYTAGNVCADTAHAHAKVQIQTSGDQNQDLDVTVYVVAPVCIPASYDPNSVPNLNLTLPGAQPAEPQPPQTQDRPGLWLGLTYSSQLDNRLAMAEKEKLYREFLQQTQAKLDSLDTSKYRYLERSIVGTDRRFFDKAFADAGVATPGAQTVLVPHTEPFAPQPGFWLNMTGLSLTVGLVLWAVMVTLATYSGDDVETQGPPKPTLRGYFIPTRQSYGLAVLLDVNIAVFVVMVFAGLGFIAFDTQDLIAWGGNYGPALMQGEIYRLVTSQFVHGGVMHLANNMYGLLIAGIILGAILPNWRLILCYLVTGLGGSIAGAILHPQIVSVGASGAILGLWGVLVALAALKDPRIAEQKKMILTNGMTFAVLTIAMGSFTPGIDNAAHIGGFVTGLLIGGGVFLADRTRTSRVVA